MRNTTGSKNTDSDNTASNPNISGTNASLAGFELLADGLGNFARVIWYSAMFGLVVAFAVEAHKIYQAVKHPCTYEPVFTADGKAAGMKAICSR